MGANKHRKRLTDNLHRAHLGISEADSTNPKKRLVSVSGGKDSTATLLVALESHPHDEVMAAFADTGNEHEATYDYVRYLERARRPDQMAASRLFGVVGAAAGLRR